MTSQQTASARRSILYLSEQDVVSAGLTMREVIDIVEGVYRRHGTGRVLMPSKRGFEVSEIESRWTTTATAMFAFDGGPGLVGIKWIGENHANAADRGLPNIVATILLNDGESFWPRAILQGAWITGMRTGAETAVGMKHLSRPEVLDGRGTVSILGCGVQGRFQMQAIMEVARPERVVAFDPSPAALDRFCRDMAASAGERGATVEKAETSDEAVSSGDVVVSITSAPSSPLIRRECLKPGALVCALGSRQELSLDTVRTASKLVVDDTEQMLHSDQLVRWVASGRLRERDVFAEIGDIVAGKKPGRETEDEMIVYMPGGMATLDIAVGARVTELAECKGLGVRLPY